MKVVLSIQSLPLCADTCGIEWKLWMAHKTMHNDRILWFFAIDSMWETTQPTACRYYTVIKSRDLIGIANTYSGVVHENLPIMTRCSFSPCTCQKTPGPQDKIKPWKIAIHEAIVSTTVTYSLRVGMPTNLTQQKGWEFGETPYKTVATSV